MLQSPYRGDTSKRDANLTNYSDSGRGGDAALPDDFKEDLLTISVMFCATVVSSAASSCAGKSSAGFEEFCWGRKYGSGDGTRKLPSGVQYKTPVSGLGDFVPQKLKHFDICERLFCPQLILCSSVGVSHVSWGIKPQPSSSKSSPGQEAHSIMTLASSSWMHYRLLLSIYSEYRKQHFV